MSYLVSIYNSISCNQIIRFGLVGFFSFVLVFFFLLRAKWNHQEASCLLLRMHQKLAWSDLVRARYELWYLLQMALSHSLKSSIDLLDPSNQLTIYESIYSNVYSLL